MAIDRPGPVPLGNPPSSIRAAEARSTGLRFGSGFAVRWSERAALAAILVATGVLGLARIGSLGYANTYYAAAVRSMLESWHNFFFVSFDPGGFVSVDKPPAGYWIQTASAKLLGFHGWSILLPQALAGVVSVLVLFLLVRAAFGPMAGLVAAAALALTPVAIADNRNNTVDSLLVLTLLLAAAAVLRAVATGRLRWLLLGMMLVGAGFNIKMLEAYLALPALVALYFFAAPLRWRTRVWHLAIAGIVLLAVSLSWSLAVDLTPPALRPYVGSSQHNSEIELAFGYNGVQRILGMRPPGAPRGGRPAANAAIAPTEPETGAPPAVTPGSPAGPAGAAGFGPPGGGPPGFVQGSASLLRLFDQQLAGQASWLLPLAVAGAAAAVALSARRDRPLHRLPVSSRQAHLMLWGIWLLTCAGFFSVASFFHPYYLVMLAPPVAALAGIGFGGLFAAARRTAAAGWTLAFLLLVTGATQVYLLRPYPQWSSRLAAPVLLLCLLGASAIALALLLRRRRDFPMALAAGATLGLVGVLLVPAVWSILTVTQGDGGGMPAGGPAGASFFGPQVPALAGGRLDLPASPPPGTAGPPLESQSQGTLLAYLQEHRAGALFLAAVPSAMEAAPLIIQTGQPIMAIGGFSGSDPILTADQIAGDVAKGTVKFFLLPSRGLAGAIGPIPSLGSLPPPLPPGAGFPPAAPGGAPPGFVSPPPSPPGPGFFAQIEPGLPPFGGPGPGFLGLGGEAERWVTANCNVVPAADWQQSGSGQGRFGLGPGGEQLYACG